MESMETNLDTGNSNDVNGIFVVSRVGELKNVHIAFLINLLRLKKATVSVAKVSSWSPQYREKIRTTVWQSYLIFRETRSWPKLAKGIGREPQNHNVIRELSLTDVIKGKSFW